MIYYDLFYTDMLEDRGYYVNLNEKSIIIRKETKLIKLPVEEFVVRMQNQVEVLHLLRMAGIDFEDHFLPYEIKTYGLDHVSDGFSSR